jgi:hypothetical protein
MDTDEKTGAGEEWRSNLSDYMQAKGVGGTCPVCSKDAGWSQYWSKHGVVSVPVMTPDGDPFITGGGAISTIAMSCKNCGYIMLFDQKKFQRWEKENGRLPE